LTLEGLDDLEGRYATMRYCG